MLLKTSAYVKSCNGETKWINVLIKEVQLLKKCTGIWINVSTSIKKELDCKPINIKFFFENKNMVIR